MRIMQDNSAWGRRSTVILLRGNIYNTCRHSLESKWLMPDAYEGDVTWFLSVDLQDCLEKEKWWDQVKISKGQLGHNIYS